MSDVLTPADHLDSVCEQFIARFSHDPEGNTGRTAQVDDLNLSLGMIVVELTYRDEEEQLRYFAKADTSVLETYGNPSAHIRTRTADRLMAFYNYDRTTGLIVVNDYSFPKDDTRLLRPQEVHDIGFSVATAGIRGIRRDNNRVLTEQGIERITADLQKHLKPNNKFHST